MHVSDVTLLDTVNSKYPILRFEIGRIEKYLEGGFFKTVFEICVTGEPLQNSHLWDWRKWSL